MTSWAQVRWGLLSLHVLWRPLKSLKDYVAPRLSCFLSLAIPSASVALTLPLQGRERKPPIWGFPHFGDKPMFCKPPMESSYVEMGSLWGTFCWKKKGSQQRPASPFSGQTVAQILAISCGFLCAPPAFGVRGAQRKVRKQVRAPSSSFQAQLR